MIEYLKDLDSCFICPEQTTKKVSGYNRTQDHIIPTCAKKLYRQIVRPIYKRPFNKAVVCRGHHEVIDYFKISLLRDFGLLGLVTFIAVEYPNGRESLEDIIRRQRLELFESLRGTVNQAKSWPNLDIPKSEVRRFPLVIETIDMCIDTYKSGLLMVPDLVTPTYGDIKLLAA